MLVCKVPQNLTKFDRVHTGLASEILDALRALDQVIRNLAFDDDIEECRVYRLIGAGQK